MGNTSSSGDAVPSDDEEPLVEVSVAIKYRTEGGTRQRENCQSLGYVYYQPADYTSTSYLLTVLKCNLKLDVFYDFLWSPRHALVETCYCWDLAT
jgi:hypothetical protein